MRYRKAKVSPEVKQMIEEMAAQCKRTLDHIMDQQAQAPKEVWEKLQTIEQKLSRLNDTTEARAGAEVAPVEAR